MTERQQRVAELVADGLSYQQIALRLGIAPTTVRVHVNAIDRDLPRGIGSTPYRRVMRWMLDRRAA